VVNVLTVVPEGRAFFSPACPSAMDADKTLQCAAVDSLGKACMARIKEGSKWCPRHDEDHEVASLHSTCTQRVASLDDHGARF
jgi:hypothetical protein